MDFGNALNALRAGHKVARGDWEGGIWLTLEPDGNGETVFWYDRIMGEGKVRTQWGAFQADLLATDWEIVDG